MNSIQRFFDKILFKIQNIHFSKKVRFVAIVLTSVSWIIFIATTLFLKFSPAKNNYTEIKITLSEMEEFKEPEPKFIEEPEFDEFSESFTNFETFNSNSVISQNTVPISENVESSENQAQIQTQSSESETQSESESSEQKSWFSRFIPKAKTPPKPVKNRNVREELKNVPKRTIQTATLKPLPENPESVETAESSLENLQIAEKTKTEESLRKIIASQSANKKTDFAQENTMKSVVERTFEKYVEKPAPEKKVEPVQQKVVAKSTSEPASKSSETQKKSSESSINSNGFENSVTSSKVESEKLDESYFETPESSFSSGNSSSSSGGIATYSSYSNGFSMETHMKALNRPFGTSVAMDNGKMRTLLEPEKPVITISDAKTAKIVGSHTLQISFEILPGGNVLLAGINVSASGLPPSVISEIKEQVSRWRFSPESSKSTASFEFLILKK